MKRGIIIAIVVLAVVLVSAVLFVPLQAIRPVPLMPFADGDNWMVASPLVYERESNKKVYTVPDGFVTDFASIPRPLWPIYPKTGRYQLAAVVHDYLYWEQPVSRRVADEIFLEAMKESDVPKKDRLIIFHAVRKGGEKAWKKNAEQKAAGLPRIIPDEFRELPANTGWVEYREHLYKKGIRP